MTHHPLSIRRSRRRPGVSSFRPPARLGCDSELAHENKQKHGVLNADMRLAPHKTPKKRTGPSDGGGLRGFAQVIEEFFHARY